VRHALVLAGLVTGAALLVGGCADQRAGQPVDTTNRFLTALADGDTTAACQLLAPTTSQSLTSDGEPCGDALAALALPTEPARDASVWSDRAQVHSDGDTLFLVDLADGWRIAAAGCTRAEEDTYDCALESG